MYKINTTREDRGNISEYLRTKTGFLFLLFGDLRMNGGVITKSRLVNYRTEASQAKKLRIRDSGTTCSSENRDW